MTSGIPQPTTIALRPLTKGMHLDTPALATPLGAFSRLNGYDVHQKGLRRVDGRTRFIRLNVPFWSTDEEVDDILSYWGTANAKFNVALTRRGLYKLEYANDFAPVAPVFWQRDYSVSSYASSTGFLTLATYNPQTERIRAGDYVVLATAPTIRHEILEVNASQVRIAAGLSIVAGAAFNIYRPFAAKAPYYVDYTFYSRAQVAGMILVDGSDGGIYAYDGSYLKPFELYFPGVAPAPSTPAYTSARTVLYFAGRLYFGCVGMLGVEYRQRIIWSEVIDLKQISETSYQDLNETSGQLLKLVGLGSLAFAYFTDGAYFGRQTNLAGLPYAFTKLDTGGVGLAAQRAAVPFFDGQLFLGQDDIYSVTASGGIESIGSPIRSETIERALSAGTMEQTVIRVDSQRQRVLFGFSTGGSSELNALYALNYRTKAWSQISQRVYTAIDIVDFADEVEFDDIDPAATFTDYTDTAFEALGGSYAGNLLTFADPAGFIYTLLEGSDSDVESDGVTSVPIAVALETGDMDFDSPDVDKTVLEVRVKVADAETHRVAPLEWRVAISIDQGQSWKQCGTLTIPLFKSEGAASVRATGSHFRLRFEGESIAAPYYIAEITARVVMRATEGSRASTTSNP